MGYRDDLEAAHARAEALERELVQERDRNAALVPAARSGASALERSAAGGKAARKWLGAPTRLLHERTLDGELPNSAHAELIECLRREFKVRGLTTELPGSIAWSPTSETGGSPHAPTVYIDVRDGKTHIRIDESVSGSAWLVYGILGLTIGGPLAIVAFLPVMIATYLGVLSLTAYVGALYAGCRALFRRSVAKRADRNERVLDALTALAQPHLAGD